MARSLLRLPLLAATALLLTSLTSPAAFAAVLRLGDDVVPTSEAIDLEIDADQPDFRGSVTIVIEARKAVDRFRFHARELELQKLVLQGPEGTLPTRFAAGEQDTVEVTVLTEYPLAPGKQYTLQIDFAGQLNTQGLSLYRMVQDGKGYTFTQFEDIEARGAFPCWDEPGFKIPYQLTLTVPAAHTALTNTPVAEETVENGKKRVVFARTPPLPSYLLAIATGPFEHVEIPGMSIPGRIYTVAGQSAGTGLAVAATPPILAALEQWFDRPYPYAKLDLIAIPEYWFGAMENPGLITFSESLLVIDPATATTQQRRSQAAVIAHELAHIWFGDLVTMAWWDDLWLNESFADWMGDKITHQVFPVFNLDIDMAQDAQRVMVGDARASTNPVRIPIESMGTLLQNAGLAYSKGKTVLGMFEQWLGREAFRRGVLAYLDKHAWGNARAADLWQALDKASRQPVAAAMATFIEQPGVPRVDVVPSPDGRVTLSQARFANAGASLEPMTWQIPVSLRWPAGGSSRTRTVLLGKEPVTLVLGDAPPAWLLPQADGRGYYRWTLPAADLETLVSAATEALDPRERVAVIGNLRALLDSGLVDGGHYLALLGAFASETEPQVVSALVSAIGAVEDALVPPELAGAFGAYLRRTLGPSLDRYGMAKQPGENETVALVRPRLIGWLGDEGDDPRVEAEVAELAEAFLADPAKVDRSLAGTAMRLAAHDGDAKLFETVRERFESAKDPSLRSIYLGSLGAFRDPALRQRALAYVLDGPLRPDDLFTIPATIIDDEAGADLVLGWLIANYDQVAGRLPPMFRVFLPSFGSGCSRERWQKAETFFADPARQVDGMELQLRRTEESVETCVALRQRAGQAAADYLRASAGETPSVERETAPKGAE